MDYIFIIAKGLNSHARTALRPLYIIYLRLELIVACFCLWRDYIRVEWIGSFVKPISERKFRFIPIGRFFGENSGARISWCLLIYMYIYIYIRVRMKSESERRRQWQAAPLIRREHTMRDKRARVRRLELCPEFRRGRDLLLLSLFVRLFWANGDARLNKNSVGLVECETRA